MADFRKIEAWLQKEDDELLYTPDVEDFVETWVFVPEEAQQRTHEQYTAIERLRAEEGRACYSAPLEAAPFTSNPMLMFTLPRAPWRREVCSIFDSLTSVLAALMQEMRVRRAVALPFDDVEELHTFLREQNYEAWYEIQWSP